MPEIERRLSRSINLGGLSLGGEAPIRVQSMTNTDTRDVQSTCAQIDRLVAAGCEIVRVAVPDDKAVPALAAIKERTAVPLVADIHFDHRLAIASLAAGADGVRINPGNVGGIKNTLLVAEAADRSGGCLRVGVNAGSLEKELLEKHGRPTPAALVESGPALDGRAGAGRVPQLQGQPQILLGGGEHRGGPALRGRIRSAAAHRADRGRTADPGGGKIGPGDRLYPGPGDRRDASGQPHRRPGDRGPGGLRDP